MALINPHPAYSTTETEVQNASCEIGCVEKFIPKHLRENELFKKVSSLMCYYENAWTDAEIRKYLYVMEEFYRSQLTNGDFQILNWFSLMDWIEAGNYNWTDEILTDEFSSDFYQKYSLSTKDIWLSMSAANDEQFNEDGFNYYSWFLEPYVGTNLLQRKLLEKIDGVDGQVIDWYNTNGITNSYSFQFAEFPGWEKAKVLIIGSRLLKNAESILLSLKDENCPDRFLLSHSFLDTDYLSDITALQFEGVTICFQRFVDEYINNTLDLFRIGRDYTKEHEELINYFIIRKLSDDFVLDELQENKIYFTHTQMRPVKFIQLLPAWMPWNNTWSAGVTWEDHYDWQSIIITNHVRNYLDKERNPLYWSAADVWGRWVGWEGDPAEWTYNKPAASRNEYYENGNFITGFEPSTKRSLYKTLTFSKKTRQFLADIDVDNNRSRIINFWLTESQLSENLYLDVPLSKLVYSEHTQEIV